MSGSKSEPVTGIILRVLKILEKHMDDAIYSTLVKALENSSCDDDFVIFLAGNPDPRVMKTFKVVEQVLQRSVDMLDEKRLCEMFAKAAVV